MLAMQVGSIRRGASISQRALRQLQGLNGEILSSATSRKAGAAARAAARRAGEQLEEDLQVFADRRLQEVTRRLEKATGIELKVPSRVGSTTIMRGSVSSRIEDVAELAAQRARAVFKADGDEATARVRAHLETVSRTGANAAHNAAVLAVARANRKVINGVMALATLDLRTTEICRPRHGAAWDLETGMPMAWSASQERFPGRPPWHYRCRTTLVPVFRDSDLPTDEILDWEEWTATDPAREALGERNLDLYARGLMTSSQLIR